ncbi:biliverdin-producing heme oxygenase [Corynebacterium callunae]|uniref:biliverdin-producing heme oxygenase n=1 Tax=Corynebacterium callunae TaxID=1721 RepID=UPI003982C320
MSTSLKDETHLNARSLSEDLRRHTAKAHESAEYSPFISDLLGGKLDQAAFIALQEQSWLFYSALEGAVRRCSEDPRSKVLLDRRLERREALEKDLDALHGHAGWRAQVAPTAATTRYVNRLNEIAAAADFPCLMAHHYVRYLGDLSGGQVIARLVGREYGIGAEALSFYEFSDIGKIKPYKDSYRAQLDALTLTPAEHATMLAEAALAFSFNQQVFASLG